MELSVVFFLICIASELRAHALSGNEAVHRCKKGRVGLPADHAVGPALRLCFSLPMRESNGVPRTFLCVVAGRSKRKRPTTRLVSWGGRVNGDLEIFDLGFEDIERCGSQLSALPAFWENIFCGSGQPTKYAALISRKLTSATLKFWTASSGKPCPTGSFLPQPTRMSMAVRAIPNLPSKRTVAVRSTSPKQQAATGQG